MEASAKVMLLIFSRHLELEEDAARISMLMEMFPLAIVAQTHVALTTPMATVSFGSKVIRAVTSPVTCPFQPLGWESFHPLVTQETI
jgi:hypothetical protein